MSGGAGLALAALVACVADPAPGRASLSPAAAAALGLDTSASRPPSVVLFLTDDQRFDSLWAMPVVQERLVGAGLSFERAYVNTPMCCPARASIAAGGFLARDTGVLTNDPPNGGAGRFDGRDSLAVQLQGAGYRTALVGKYLNNHDPGTVPPGWSTWANPLIDLDWESYDVALGSSTADAAGSTTTEAVDQYLADWITERSEAFLDEVGEDEPFFLWVNHFAPHFPSTPAAEDAGTFEGLTWRGGAFDELFVSDKPPHFADIPPLTRAAIEAADALYADSLETLLAVDRSVEDLLDHLEASGRIEDTVFLFASDNGYLWGEHRLYHKGLPYEEAVRVPLIALAPGGATGTDSRLVSVTTDLGATILDLAGVDAPTDGLSLVPVLAGVDPDWRQRLLIEGYEGSTVPVYAGVVSPRWKYIEYTAGGSELYDLEGDPFELWSQHARPATREVREAMAAWLDEHRGIALQSRSHSFVEGEAGEVTLSAWGGTPPYTFEARTAVPAGLTLATDGTLSGTPESAGSHVVEVRVRGAGLRAYDGDPEDFTGAVRIQVLEASSGLLPPPPSPEVALGRHEVVLRLRAPAGAPVAAILSPVGDFEDGRRLSARGPEAVLRFSDLAPGRRYRLRVEGPAGDSELEVETLP